MSVIPELILEALDTGLCTCTRAASSSCSASNKKKAEEDPLEPTSVATSAGLLFSNGDDPDNDRPAVARDGSMMVPYRLSAPRSSIEESSGLSESLRLTGGTVSPLIPAIEAEEDDRTVGEVCSSLNMPAPLLLPCRSDISGCWA